MTHKTNTPHPLPLAALALSALLIIPSCAAVGRTLGQWLAKAEEIGAVRCEGLGGEPRAYAVCMGEAGGDAAVIVAAERLRAAVRRALEVAAPGAGAEDSDAEREDAARELGLALQQWQSVTR